MSENKTINIPSGREFHVKIAMKELPDGSFQWQMAGKEVSIVNGELHPLSCITIANKVINAYLGQQLEALQRDSLQSAVLTPH